MNDACRRQLLTKNKHRIKTRIFREKSIKHNHKHSQILLNPNYALIWSYHNQQERYSLISHRFCHCQSWENWRRLIFDLTKTVWPMSHPLRTRLTPAAFHLSLDVYTSVIWLSDGCGKCFKLLPLFAHLVMQKGNQRGVEWGAALTTRVGNAVSIEHRPRLVLTCRGRHAKGDKKEKLNCYSTSLHKMKIE